MEIDGMEELLNKLNHLDTKAMIRAVHDSVGKGIEIVRANAVLRCPGNHGELRGSIKTRIEATEQGYRGTCYTNKAYAMYVEFGTGPKGKANHAGITPEVTPAYTLKPWWVHESQIDKADAERYHWFSIDTPKGRFYEMVGQAAHPFLYPAMDKNKDRVVGKIKQIVKKQLEGLAND